MAAITYDGGMSEQTLRVDLDEVAEVQRVDGLEVATLTRYDIPALAALHVVAYDEEPTPENLVEAYEEIRLYFEGAFGRPLDHSFVGAWLDGTLVGAIICVEESPWDDMPDGPCVLDVVVDPDYRRRGIASALVAEVAQRGITWGWDSLSLRVGPEHANAALMYRSMGFEG